MSDPWDVFPLIVTTYDVFCDGLGPKMGECANWEHGVVDGASPAIAARAAAANQGWARWSVNGRMRDLCPGCKDQVKDRHGR